MRRSRIVFQVKKALRKECTFGNLFLRFVLDKQPAKVIHLKSGNLLLKDLHAFFHDHWSQIIAHLQDAGMIIATANGLEVFPYRVLL